MDQTPKILYQDEDIAIVDKPAGMIVNRSDTSRHVTTLQDFSESIINNQQSNLRGKETSEFITRGGIVHRLDKETSGILVIAKNEEVFENLQAQFKSREVKKEYIALAHGKIEPTEGKIDIPIGRLPWNRTKFGVLPEGRESQTLYKVVAYKKIKIDKLEEDLSLVEVYPQTGRTHQIRVHMRHIGHPIFGDELYAGRKNARRDRRLLSRHFLHASKITFDHPKTGQSMTFESPLPGNLSDFLSTFTNNQLLNSDSSN